MVEGALSIVHGTEVPGKGVPDRLRRYGRRVQRQREANEENKGKVIHPIGIEAENNGPGTCGQ